MPIIRGCKIDDQGALLPLIKDRIKTEAAAIDIQAALGSTQGRPEPPQTQEKATESLWLRNFIENRQRDSYTLAMYLRANKRNGCQSLMKLINDKLGRYPSS